jgi:PhnB protein
MSVKAVPEGYETVTPYLMVPDPAALIEFLETAFGAQDVHRMTGPDGRIMHAQVRVGTSFLMMGGATEQWPAMPASFYLYVEDADATFDRALQAGGTLMMPMGDQFWGDRMGTVADPQGNHWSIATRIEEVSPEEMAARSQAAMASGRQAPG